MTLKLLTEHHLELLSQLGGCTCSSESTGLKVSHCWKSRVTVHLNITDQQVCKPVTGIDVNTTLFYDSAVTYTTIL